MFQQFFPLFATFFSYSDTVIFERAVPDDFVFMPNRRRDYDAKHKQAEKFSEIKVKAIKGTVQRDGSGRNQAHSTGLF